MFNIRIHPYTKIFLMTKSLISSIMVFNHNIQRLQWCSHTSSTDVGYWKRDISLNVIELFIIPYYNFCNLSWFKNFCNKNYGISKKTNNRPTRVVEVELRSEKCQLLQICVPLKTMSEVQEVAETVEVEYWSLVDKQYEMQLLTKVSDYCSV